MGCCFLFLVFYVLIVCIYILYRIVFLCLVFLGITNHKRTMSCFITLSLSASLSLSVSVCLSCCLHVYVLYLFERIAVLFLFLFCFCFLCHIARSFVAWSYIAAVSSLFVASFLSVPVLRSVIVNRSPRHYFMPRAFRYFFCGVLWTWRYVPVVSVDRISSFLNHFRVISICPILIKSRE